MREEVARRLRTALTAAELEVTPVDERRLMSMLSGEWKRTIPVLFELGDRTLKVTSLFTSAPDEGHEAVYRILLQRNQHPGPVHFALDDEGDVIITGAVPYTSLDDRGIDELLGAVLRLADETFNQVLRTGFAGYLAAEQRWRERAGLPPNPVGDAAPSDRIDSSGAADRARP